MRIEGKVWVFPANITTEDILPNQFLDRANDEVGQFAMAGVDSEFVDKVQPGDVIVGGPNFGTGSSRETAAIALKLAGIGAVVAPSLGRVFFRNCINIGLPAVIIDATDDFQEGDQVLVDLQTHMVTNHRTGLEYPIRNLSGVSLEILQAGGIIPYTKQRQANRHGN
jgi:3-isopropylmalate/(R)-2-methylmalate dehydratase small subunit